MVDSLNNKTVIIGGAYHFQGLSVIFEGIEIEKLRLKA